MGLELAVNMQGEVVYPDPKRDAFTETIANRPLLYRVSTDSTSSSFRQNWPARARNKLHHLHARIPGGGQHAVMREHLAICRSKLLQNAE